MPLTSDQVYDEAISLPREARAALTKRLVRNVAKAVPAEIVQAQLGGVRRRIEQVESGEVRMIPGDQALARVRRLLADQIAAGQ